MERRVTEKSNRSREGKIIGEAEDEEQSCFSQTDGQNGKEIC